jgi:outer membrane protein, adhesin transport system
MRAMKLAVGAAAALILLSPQAAMAQTATRHGLEQLVAIAIRTHPGVSARRAELGAAQAEVEAARWQYFPTPSMQLRNQDNGTTATVVAVQQPLWAGGRLDAGLDAADSRARSAGVSIAEAQYNLALRVTNAWQSWMQARGRGNAMTKSVAQLEGYADSVRRRIAGGVSAEVDHELVISRLAQARSSLSTARAAERTALAQLSQMVGQPLRADGLAIPDGVEDKVPPLAALVDQMTATSPVLRRLDADIQTARHEVVQKDAALWPTLALRAEHQRADATATSLAVNDNRVMLVLDYVPGAGLSAAAGADAARARIGGLMESREAARRDLVEKVSTDYEDHLASRDRRRDLRNTLKASAEVLASYDRLFVAGKRSWLDVLNAARELTEVEISLADVEAQLVASRYRLRLHGGELPQGEAS